MALEKIPYLSLAQIPSKDKKAKRDFPVFMLAQTADNGIYF